MTILVDEARWPWRGTRWAHLVSDRDLPELHEFARRLGCRRIGFQGDHYDIDVDTREVAIALGAVPVESRELVRRLRSAGLRLRPSQFEKWDLIERWEPMPAVEVVFEHSRVPPALGEWQTRIATLGCAWSGAFLLGRGDRVALVLHGVGAIDGAPAEDSSAGVHVRVDRQRRFAIELVDPPLNPAD